METLLSRIQLKFLVRHYNHSLAPLILLYCKPQSRLNPTPHLLHAGLGGKKCNHADLCHFKFMPTISKVAFSCCQVILLYSPSPLTLPLSWMMTLHCHFFLQIPNALFPYDLVSLFMTKVKSPEENFHGLHHFSLPASVFPHILCFLGCNLMNSPRPSLEPAFPPGHQIPSLLTYSRILLWLYCPLLSSIFNCSCSPESFHQHAGMWLSLPLYKILLLNPLLQLLTCSPLTAELLQKIVCTHCLQLVVSWKQLFRDIMDI